jgi:hypothetical protein
MKTAEQRIAQIRRPPSLPNWVRLNDRRRDETTRRITRFVLGKPRHALTQVYRYIADYVTFGLSQTVTKKAIESIPNGYVRKLGTEIADILLPWLETNNIRGIQTFHDMEARFPIGRGIVVPVKPTFVFVENGKLTPVFLIGWASFPFSDYQRSLLATIIHKAILTQEGFEESDALVICVPRIASGVPDRIVRAWYVSERAFLTDGELEAQFDRFGNALDDAVPVILEELAKRGEL